MNVKDGAKFALGMLLVKTVVVTAGSVTLAALKKYNERDRTVTPLDINSAYPTTDNGDGFPFSGFTEVPQDQVPDFMKDLMRDIVRSKLSKLDDDTRDQLREDDCTDPNCIVHGTLRDEF